MKKRCSVRSIALMLLAFSVVIGNLFAIPTYALGEEDFEVIWLKEEYSDFKGFHDGLASVKKDGEWGFIDRTGKMKIPFAYEATWNFHDGLASVRKDGKWGFIDKNGKTVIPFTYDEVWNFYDGLASVKKDGKYGFIDKTGKIVISPAYDEARNFYGGLASAKKNGKWGFIDKSGNTVIPFSFDSVGYFSEGLASVKKDGKSGFIDFTGEMVIPLGKYEDIPYEYGGQDYSIYRVYNFSEDFAGVKKDGKYGFIDKTGSVEISLIYDYAWNFYEGLASVKKGQRYGFIDKIGKLVIPLVYEASGDFNKGIAIVKKNGKWGYIDKTGAAVIPIVYDYAYAFSEGLAWVKKDGKLGILRNKKYESLNDYVYDEADPGDSLVLPVADLQEVNDSAGAVKAVNSATDRITAEQKESAAGIDLLTLYSEEAVSQSASVEVEGGTVDINSQSIESLKTVSEETKQKVEKAISNAGFKMRREIETDVRFKASAPSGKVVINIDPSIVNSGVDNVKIEARSCSVTLPVETIKSKSGGDALVITVTEKKNKAAFFGEEEDGEYAERNVIPGVAKGVASKAYQVEFSRDINSSVKLALPALKGDKQYQAIFNSKNEAVGGKYNPITKKIEIKINKGDTYVVKENKKSFKDISKKSKEMQEAIEVLASKGILNGTGNGNFNPDGTISRAEIATLLVTRLSKYDGNADGGFMDVFSKDWYFGAVGSAKKQSWMNGKSSKIFAPKEIITKDQIVAVVARVLKTEMKYGTPSSPDTVLNIYSDYVKIPKWAREDVALATRENLVVKRYDGSFIPRDRITRGDAAIILYRLFKKLW